jgi:hypothetical protein
MGWAFTLQLVLLRILQYWSTEYTTQVIDSTQGTCVLGLVLYQVEYFKKSVSGTVVLYKVRANVVEIQDHSNSHFGEGSLSQASNI